MVPTGFEPACHLQQVRLPLRLGTDDSTTRSLLGWLRFIKPSLFNHPRKVDMLGLYMGGGMQVKYITSLEKGLRRSFQAGTASAVASGAGVEAARSAFTRSIAHSRSDTACFPTNEFHMSRVP